MKKLLIIALMCPLMGLAQSDYAKLFWGQMMNSCTGQRVWEKSVAELVDGQAQEAETHVYDIDCAAGTIKRVDAEDGKMPSLDEFDFLFEYDCQGPYIAEYFNLERKGKGIEAKIKEGQESETPLRSQTFQVDELGNLRYAAAHIVKDTRLYYMEIEVEVWFDPGGRYTHHKVRTSTSPLFDEGISTLVTGKFN